MLAAEAKTAVCDTGEGGCVCGAWSVRGLPRQPNALAAEVSVRLCVRAGTVQTENTQRYQEVVLRIEGRLGPAYLLDR